jgi:CRISPR-associated protein Cmr4
MSIVREPGTGVPKIPGTSLSGACRTYAAMQKPDKWPHCAGQGQPVEKRKYQGHCGDLNCPICVTFGFSRGDKSFQGLAQFSDARLVLFPVHSLAGPVWVTCPDVLRDLKVWDANWQEPSDVQVRPVNGFQVGENLNLGWLMLDVAGNGFSLDSKLDKVPQEIRNRAALVSNKLFSHIVNDNLEVRTSVSIDPQTGAAAEGALYTYEALPRASVLAFEVVISDPKFYKIDGEEPLRNKGGKGAVKNTVEDGLRFFEALGVGGMTTRGMGRLRVLGLQAGGGQ